MFRITLKILCFICLFLIGGCVTTIPEGNYQNSSSIQRSGKQRFEYKNTSKADFLKSKEAKDSAFILGPGDKIEITVYRHDELSKTLWIGPSGKIIYPLIGDIQASGLSIFELREKIRDGLSKYIIDPKVGINIITVQSQSVAVLGEVKKPGSFFLDHPLTVLEAISLAGGFTIKAKQGSVFLIRKGLEKQTVKVLNLKKAIKKGDLTYNVVLQRGDIIYVPEKFF